jgi:hypothetical protein
MSQPRQLTEEEKRRFQEFVKNRAVVANKAPAKSSGSKKDDSSTNLFQWCVDDIVERLKSVEGLSKERKLMVQTSDFKDYLFGQIFDQSMQRLFDPIVSPLSLDFIEAWRNSEDPEEQEALLNIESKSNREFIPMLCRSYIEAYIYTCKEYSLSFDPRVSVTYMSV